jgi:hypothetical protein
MMYFHSGLDIMLPNGTPMYAIESGYVKYIHYDLTGYAFIIIGDTPGTEPGNAWSYGHVNNFHHQEGDYVQRGEQIAEIFFKGLEHIHLGKIYSETGLWDSNSGYYHINPYPYFIYQDTEPPTIQAPLFYFKNNSDTFFAPDAPTVVYGAVDIVAGIRDGGEYAHYKSGLYGDRLCVAQLEYEIYSDRTGASYRKSFDFRKLIIKNLSSYNSSQVSTIFKAPWLLEDIAVTQDGSLTGDKFYSFYILTNCPIEGFEDAWRVNPDYSQLSWDTLALDGNGNRLFPNGLYRITVKAIDFAGNSSTVSDEVMVLNRKKKSKGRR